MSISGPGRRRAPSEAALRRLGLVVAAWAAVSLLGGPGGGGGGGGGGGSTSAPSVGYTSTSGEGDSMRGLYALLIAAGVACVAYGTTAPTRVAELIVTLPAGRYLPILDEAMARADFAAAEGRGRLLKELLRAIGPEDLGNSVALGHESGKWNFDDLVQAGARLYRRRMAEASLEERQPGEVLEARLADREGGLHDHGDCVLGLVTSVRSREPVEGGGHRAALALIERLKAESERRPPLLLYVYYAPDPGRALGPREAGGLLRSWARAGGLELEEMR